MLKYGAGVARAGVCDADAKLLEESCIAHAVDDASAHDIAFTLNIWMRTARILRWALAMTSER